MCNKSFHIPGPGPIVVLVCPEPSEHDSLDGILQRGKGRLHCFRTCRETVSFLSKHPAGVVISNTDLPDGTWKDLLAQTTLFPVAPNLIVVSHLADERLWAEVLNMGGYDLLLVPYDADEAIRVITLAWLDWERRRAAPVRSALSAKSTLAGFSGKRILARGSRAAAAGRRAGNGTRPNEDLLRMSE